MRMDALIIELPGVTHVLCATEGHEYMGMRIVHSVGAAYLMGETNEGDLEVVQTAEPGNVLLLREMGRIREHEPAALETEAASKVRGDESAGSFLLTRHWLGRRRMKMGRRRGGKRGLRRRWKRRRCRRRRGRRGKDQISRRGRVQRRREERVIHWRTRRRSERRGRRKGTPERDFFVVHNERENVKQTRNEKTQEGKRVTPLIDLIVGDDVILFR